MKAFPTDRLGVIKDTRSISINEAQQDGMDLRDYFAAKAMQALITQIESGKESQIAAIPSISYDIADEMMKARKQ